MVGIAFSDDKQEMELMLEVIHHFSFHIKERCNNIAAGIVRLKQLDVFKFEDDNFSIILDGFIYNNSLEDITKLYQKEKENAFVNLDGEFSLIFYSKIEDVVYIVNDTFGLRNCFYSVYQGRLLVCTEAKAIAKIIQADFDETAIYAMTCFGKIFKDLTLFKNVYRLMPGHYTRYDRKNKKIRFKNYYKFSYRPKKTVESQVVKKTALLFKKALNKRFQNNKKNILALSGGLDSRSAAILLKDKKIHTFTFGQGNDADSTIAKKVAEKLSLQNTLITYHYNEQKIIDLIEFTAYLVDGLSSVANCHGPYILSQIYKKYDVMFYFNGLDSVLGANQIGNLRRSDFEKNTPEQLMLKKSYFNSNESKKLFLVKPDIKKLIKEHFEFVGIQDPLVSFDYASLLATMYGAQRGPLITRNFLEEKLAVFDREFISHIEEIPIELRIRHYIFYKFLKYIHPELARIKSATTGLTPASNNFKKFISRYKRYGIKILRQKLHMNPDPKTKYFEANLVMRLPLWVKKYEEHVLHSSIVKKYINIQEAEKILKDHIEYKSNNGTKLMAILSIAVSLNVLSGEKSYDNSKKSLEKFL